MTLRSRLTGATLVLTLSAFGLAACGSDDSGADADATDAPSQTDEAAPEATDDSADDQGEDGKPSKQEVVDGYTDLVGELMGDVNIPADILDTVVTCFVDEVYDDASAQTLNAIADGDQMGVDPADTTLFTDASSTCQKEAIG